VLHYPASNAARIGRVAWETGKSLTGTKFIVTGEPFTEAKRQMIERVGAKGTSRYAYGGGLNIGFGCADPCWRFSLIQSRSAERAWPSIPFSAPR
jgi:hypothetical protein